MERMDPFSWISQHSMDGGQVRRCIIVPKLHQRRMPSVNALEMLMWGLWGCGAVDTDAAAAR